MVKVKEDLTGRKFERLLVIEQAEDRIARNGEHVAMWKCLCDCGNEYIVRGSQLKGGKAKSCGCLLREILIQRNKSNCKTNKWELKDNIAIGYDDNNKSFIIDLEDYDICKDIYWSVGAQDYVCGKVNNKAIKIHRFIFNIHKEEFSFDKIIDHINHNKTDNRKNNLRIVNNSQNLMNSKLRVDNTSGVKGVSWNTLQNKWLAHIRVNGKGIHLGYFDNLEDAAKVRKEAEIQYFGEYRNKELTN